MCRYSNRADSVKQCKRIHGKCQDVQESPDWIGNIAAQRALTTTTENMYIAECRILSRFGRRRVERRDELLDGEGQMLIDHETEHMARKERIGELPEIGMQTQ